MTASPNLALAPFPWDFLEELDPALLSLEGVPLSSTPKGFSLQRFASTLGQRLKAESLSVEILDPTPVKNPLSKEWMISYKVPGIEGTVAFFTSASELQNLLLHLLGQKQGGALPEEYLYPFWQFLKTTLKDVFSQSFEGEPLSFEEAEVPNEDLGLQYSIVLSVGEKRFFSTLYTSELFIKEWRKSSLRAQRQGHLTELLSKRIDIPLHLVVGDVELSKRDWGELENGDTLLLDRLTYPPQGEKGDGILYFEETPLYRVKIKTGAIKVMAQASGVKIMTSIEPEPTAHDEQEDQAEQHLSEDQETEELGQEMEGLDEDDALEEAEVSTAALETDEPRLSLHDLPLQIHIEMGRFKLPLHQVLELQTGNVLKLDVDPRKGVDLVVEGKVIGRGELVKIGDLFGVRITDLQ